MITLLTILIALISIFAGFLAKELLKKFRFWKQFQKNYHNQSSWTYAGKKKPWMYTLRLSANQDFHGLIGFDFSLWPIKNGGYDIFWYISSKDGNCTISLYLGKWACTFIFLLDKATDISIEILKENTESDYTFLPHWWQKWSIFR